MNIKIYNPDNDVFYPDEDEEDDIKEEDTFLNKKKINDLDMWCYFVGEDK